MECWEDHEFARLQGSSCELIFTTILKLPPASTSSLGAETGWHAVTCMRVEELSKSSIHYCLLDREIRSLGTIRPRPYPKFGSPSESPLLYPRGVQ